ncbi:hypothetical protein KPH14_006244 [Odynerus spinipes]|uniref:Non-structural maintenance of chromosomes element 4 n=1 Tax=Odynerus spinipes TaxID=1348599 RepID=A0AAD9RIU7_9HYME|nr:hypothetical protein KPH14_006244 [Odynerus spinipes]
MSGSANSSERQSMTRSPQERKEILWTAFSHVLSLQERNEYLAIDDLRILEEVMKEGDDAVLETSLDETTCNPEEMFLDSKTMNISSKILTSCTKSVTQNISYSHVEFAEKLLQYTHNLPNAGLETPDWSVLEKEVTKFFNRTADYTSLSGILIPPEEKEIVKKKAPAIREAQAQMKSPENVTVPDKEEESVEETVYKIKKFIRHYYKINQKPLDFYCLILHPHDFGKTIENMLYISFLVRDGIIKLVKDNSGMLAIQLCSKEATIQRKQVGASVNIQNIMSLNIAQWKILKDAYKLEKPMLDS